ncbi:MAG: amidinotransferase [Deltaproteobacteria bacterium]|nr:amidinotransferase [Deltaproteobacteria bacterium]
MRLLMCPPIYYGIEYEINPWMRRNEPSDPEVAKEQWRMLSRLLQDEMDVDVTLAEPIPGLPDMVFTANAGLVWEETFIPSKFRHEVRRGEVAHYEEWFQVRGYDIVHLPGDDFFEGEGDILFCGDRFYAGYLIRSEIHPHEKIAEILQHEVLSLELTNKWFYHLDTCFCPLGGNRAMYYPGAFDSYGVKVIESHISTLVPVPEAEAMRFACNAIVDGSNIVMNDGCPEVKSSLEKLGFTVYQTPLSEFIKAGGSAKCLALKVPHYEDTD